MATFNSKVKLNCVKSMMQLTALHSLLATTAWYSFNARLREQHRQWIDGIGTQAFVMPPKVVKQNSSFSESWVASKI